MLSRLGLVSFWRNRHRSAVGVVSIALAAMVFVGATLIAQGVPGLANRTEREFVGGDIVVLGFKRPNAFELTDPTRTWEYGFMSYNLQSQYDVFDPEPFHHGALRDPTSQSLSSGFLQELGRHPEVEFVYPYYRLPVIVEDEGGEHLAYLRARKPEYDRRLGFDHRVVDGRYFSAEHSGQYVGLVDCFRPNISTTNAARFGYDQFNGKWVSWIGAKSVVADYPVPSVGEVLKVQVPKWNTSGKRPVPNFAAAVQHELRIIGTFELPTRTVRWPAQVLTLDGMASGQRVDEDYPDHYGVEQLYWSTSELLVPWETFLRIRQQVIPQGELPVMQAALKLRNFAEVNRVVEELRHQFPTYTVVSVPQLAGTHDVMPEPMFRTPPGDLRGLRSAKPETAPAAVQVPSWMRQITVILLYLAGGMMLAGNVYVTLLLRKKELGLFLALGARRYQLILLILTEVLLVGLSGALLGFILMLPMALWQYLSSSASVQVLLGALGKNLLLLLVSTVTASALFGAVPAWYASRLPVSEVLTGE